MIFLPALSAALVLAATAAVPAAASPLPAQQWERRVVLVFGERGDPGVSKQLEALLKDREALGERDMIVIAVSDEGVSVPFGEAGQGMDAGALRQGFRVDAGASLTTILVGKDGGEKLRRTEPVPAEAIFALIDAMPMRQSEMRKQ